MNEFKENLKTVYNEYFDALEKEHQEVSNNEHQANAIWRKHPTLSGMIDWLEKGYVDY